MSCNTSHEPRSPAKFPRLSTPNLDDGGDLFEEFELDPLIDDLRDAVPRFSVTHDLFEAGPKNAQ